MCIRDRRVVDAETGVVSFLSTQQCSPREQHERDRLGERRGASCPECSRDARGSRRRRVGERKTRRRGSLSVRHQRMVVAMNDRMSLSAIRFALSADRVRYGRGETCLSAIRASLM